MKIIELSLRSVFMQKGFRDGPAAPVSEHQVLDHYESVLTVEVDHRIFTAERHFYQQSASLAEINDMSRAVRKDVSRQVEDYIFRNGSGTLDISYPDLPGSPVKYACRIVAEGEYYEASFHVTEEFRLSAQEELLPRIEYHLKQQILRQIYNKLFEGWEIK